MSQVNPSHRRSVKSMGLKEPLVVSPDTGMLEMLRLFQKAKTHLALVSEEPALALECLRKEQRPPHSARYLGIVTLEDVLERIIQEDIQDETDAPFRSSADLEPASEALLKDKVNTLNDLSKLSGHRMKGVGVVRYFGRNRESIGDANSAGSISMHSNLYRYDAVGSVGGKSSRITLHGERGRTPVHATATEATPLNSIRRSKSATQNQKHFLRHLVHAINERNESKSSSADNFVNDDPNPLDNFSLKSS